MVVPVGSAAWPVRCGPTGGGTPRIGAVQKLPPPSLRPFPPAVSFLPALLALLLAGNRWLSLWNEMGLCACSAVAAAIGAPDDAEAAPQRYVRTGATVI